MGSLSGLWVSSVRVPTAMYSYFTSPRGAQPSERRRQPWCSLHIPHVPALESSLGKMVVMLKSSASSNAHSYQCLEAVSADMGDKHEHPLLACPKAGKTAKTHRARGCSPYCLLLSRVTGLWGCHCWFLMCSPWECS